MNPEDDLIGRLAEAVRERLMRQPPGDPCNAEDLPTGLVDVRQEVPSLLILDPPPWCSARRLLIRPETAERLREAAEHMPEGVCIGFWEGLRPRSVQRLLWRMGGELLREMSPGLSGSSFHDTLSRLIADPEAGAPPHSVGCAVDVAPVDPFRRVLAPVDPWGRLVWASFSRGMEAAGLVNYPAEWWHWSYGDDDWALANECAPLYLPLAPLEEGPGGGI